MNNTRKWNRSDVVYLKPFQKIYLNIYQRCIIDIFKISKKDIY